MSKIDGKKLLRIIDANFNRAKEGLRVCEDVCRFILDDRVKTRQFKILRHRLSEKVSVLTFGKLVDCRNIDGDVGKKSTAVELKRRNTSDIFYANAQRSKESLRVLEEFAKLLSPRLGEDLKNIRYQIYALEKKVIARFK
ncbi:MAG TPA: thiamine-phosphate pyrophosphorylase [Candidatus Omnitrophota bacterium]|nr:thiamine-phosphate pyrophosphorylase [Candidatus Omnitrophota bacterium]